MPSARVPGDIMVRADGVMPRLRAAVSVARADQVESLYHPTVSYARRVRMGDSRTDVRRESRLAIRDDRPEWMSA